MEIAEKIRSKGRYSTEALKTRAHGVALRQSNFLKGIGLLAVPQLLLAYFACGSPGMKMYRRKFAVFTP